MIQRKPSKIIDSVVNTAHDEHLNVTKAIRDDAPITNLNTVVKSVNFESADDGAYILRKPLVKKETGNANGFYIFDKEHIFTYISPVPGGIIIPKSISISNASLILKFYDNELKLHEIDLSTHSNANWLHSITSHYNCVDHTLLSVTIDHRAFLKEFSSLVRTPISNYQHAADVPVRIGVNIGSIDKSLEAWEWSLVNINKRTVDSSTTPSVESVYDYKTLSYLKRFLKITKSEEQANTFIIEIVNPELNSITSGLDVGNAETLDINLLLDNPYAIRDLYDYGYVSVTKILPYVAKSETNLTLQNIKDSTVWELTESDFIPEQTDAPNSLFRLVVSANPQDFNKNFVILKAFLTLTQTPAKYWCCWERSSDDGVTWDTCPEFIDSFETSPILVSDLTSSEYDKVLEEDTSLEKAKSHLVTKRLALLDLTQKFSIHDTLSQRPDVLILESPDLTYKYRFQIYLATNKATPVSKDVSHSITKTSFSDTGYSTPQSLDNDGKILYKTDSFGGGATEPSLDSSKLILHNYSLQPQGSTSDKNDPSRQGYGNSLTIYCNDDTYSLKEVTIALYRKENISNTTEYNYVGAAIGVLGQSTPLDPYATIDTTTNPYTISNENPYHMKSVELVKAQTGTNIYTYYVKYDCRSFWVKQNDSKVFAVSAYDENLKTITFVNLSTCLGEALKTLSGYTNASHCELKIDYIRVDYFVKGEAQTTSNYLVSTTGAYNIPYSSELKLVEDLSKDRDRLFTGEMYYVENGAQLIVYKDNYIYASGTNSAIMKLLNSLSISENVSKIVPWRGYLLIFTPKQIYLAKYDYNSDGYTIKILSNTVGVSKEDADTIIPILNSVYFKSAAKIYKLVPNLYAASDDVLNVYQISSGVNTILENIVNTYIEHHNFGYSDTDTYSIFIPVQSLSKTYCFVYEFDKQLWTLLEYPLYLTDIEKFSSTELYLKYGSALYYFRENFTTLLTKGLAEYCSEQVPALNPSDYNIQMFLNATPYADYLTKTPKELIPLVIANAIHNNSFEDTYQSVATAIPFEIDFGQKSSNYTLDKQFLETKLILATLSIKDRFPLTLDIYTDGISRDLHWDANTDGALWKSSLDDVGILNTSFSIDGQDYNGIFRQLIVKYSGKGKSIRHVISGKSKSLFKFYSMDVRARILPKKH